MEVIATRKDGTVHKMIDGKWVPPLVIPSYMHEKVLRNINEARKRKAMVQR